MRVLMIREQVPWMGARGAYQSLFGVLQADPEVRLSFVEHYMRPAGPLRRAVLGPMIRRSLGSALYDESSFSVEMRAMARARASRHDLVHAWILECQFAWLRKLRGLCGTRVVATAHYPVGWWRAISRNPEIVRWLDGLITLGSRQKTYFEQFLPGRTRFIRLPVDTDFFCPADEPRPPGRPTVLFCGQYMRDFPTLAEVVERVLARDPGIRFLMICPSVRNETAFRRIARFDQVEWRGSLSDTGLRDHYRSADLMLLPLVDSVANCAVVEGVATGLPVVSNDVEGMHDYTDPSFASLAPVGDAAAMADRVLAVVQDARAREEQARQARRFAVTNFALQVVARETVAFYRDVLAQRS